MYAHYTKVKKMACIPILCTYVHVLYEYHSKTGLNYKPTTNTGFLIRTSLHTIHADILPHSANRVRMYVRTCTRRQ